MLRELNDPCSRLRIALPCLFKLLYDGGRRVSERGALNLDVGLTAL